MKLFLHLQKLRYPIAHVYHGIFSVLFQLQSRLHSSPQPLRSPVFFKTDVKIVTRFMKNNWLLLLLHKLEITLNKTWSSFVHLPTRRTHHQQMILDQKVYATRLSQSKWHGRKLNRFDSAWPWEKKVYFKYWKDQQPLFVSVTKRADWLKIVFL